MNAADVVEAFRSAIMQMCSAAPKQVIADGVLHRFPVENDRHGSAAGWYVLHADGVPAGSYGNWRDGTVQTWRMKLDRRLTAVERSSQALRLADMKRAREEAEALRHATAARKARGLWAKAKICEDGQHAYLLRKSVRAHGARLHCGKLVIPLRGVDGRIRGLQTIAGDGQKFFTPGTQKKGAYFSIGEVGDVLLIGEGFATCATLHEATGLAVACAFDAANLGPVAEALRWKLPRVKLVIAADNDHRAAANVGVMKGRAAALSVSGQLIYPQFEPGASGTDWNDLAAASGLNVIHAAVSSVLGGSHDL